MFPRRARTVAEVERRHEREAPQPRPVREEEVQVRERVALAQHARENGLRLAGVSVSLCGG